MENDIHNLKIGHCNIQGGFTGIAKSTQVSELIAKYELDMLSLNETNLNDTIDTDSLNIPPNYLFKRADRGAGTRGGCGFLISDKCGFPTDTWWSPTVPPGRPVARPAL